MLGTTIQSLFLLLIIFISAPLASYSNAYPLSTQGRWIIDDSTGERAKMVCGNWAGHLRPMIPEGLDKRPLKELVGELVKHKFNCVRLTYAIYMWTRHGNHIVNDTFSNFDAPEVVDGIAKNNPSVLNMTHIQAFEAMVNELGAQNVKVLLDNHVSEPKWCCNDDDENGFFHDRHFDPQEWIQGLTLAAKHFANNHAVVAMSLRNELHGPRQNQNDWYRYMSHGALSIHKANPKVLVVISGLNYDTEFQFLRSKPLKIDLGKKMVYETHLYSWSGTGTQKSKQIWTKQPLNRICADSIRGLEYRAGFLTTGKNAVPLIFTELGFDESGSSVEDNRRQSST
ncbi:glycosyl hydrolase 5 family protein-like [Gastrolobium bilobum]|uniref:glycosyl hydrolase 5 family protein-like n=1 Tax=Gastrolobium bilobum TaxID=150636 RepID=UPI002AB29B7C|nr:glycosyl hydrolase 5 family protein-like [Gastrolobium bilobum]